jgi:phosphoenolpyruvate synthase/pyruvate phosphate dikinase
MKDGETDEKEDGKMKEEKVKGKAKRVAKRKVERRYQQIMLDISVCDSSLRRVELEPGSIVQWRQ